MKSIALLSIPQGDPPVGRRNSKPCRPGPPDSLLEFWLLALLVAKLPTAQRCFPSVYPQSIDMDGTSRSRDPRVASQQTSEDSSDHAVQLSQADVAKLQRNHEELGQAVKDLTAMVGRLAGPSPARGEVLAGNPANPFPRPLTHALLELPGREWAPLVPMEGNTLYQTIASRANTGKSLASTLHELPFLYSMLSYAHDAVHNFALCQQQLQIGECSEDIFAASLGLLEKVVRLGEKRYTEIQVMVEHDVPTASLLHLQNFGPSGSASVMDAGDQALLIDIRKQEMKEQKKSVLKGGKKGSGSSGKSRKSGAAAGPATPAGPRA